MTNKNTIKGKSVAFLGFFVFFLVGCGSILCTKGNTQQGIYLRFNSSPFGDSVDLGGSATIHRNASWVKKLIVEKRGFLVVTSHQTVHCDNMDDLKTMKPGDVFSCEGERPVTHYTVSRYTEAGGFEEWKPDVIPEKEWQTITELDHSFSKAPDYHYKNCRYKLFGKIQQFLQFVQRI